MGKTGSGKSELVKSALINIPRKIIIDPMGEYEGTLFDSWDVLLDFIDNYRTDDFTAVFRPLHKDDIDRFFELCNSVNDYTLIAEEVENWCGSHDIQCDLEEIISFGRHNNRSIIWISRTPYEINRDLTRQSHLLISILQTEPVDLKYLENYPFNKDITTLKEYDYAYAVLQGDENLITNIQKILMIATGIS